MTASSSQLAVPTTGRFVGLRRAVAQWRLMMSPVVVPIASAARCVSSLGWLVLGVAVGAAALASALQWREFAYAATALGILFAFSCLLTLGRMALEVETTLHPQRVVAGEAAAVELQVHNVGRSALLPSTLDLPTGDTVLRFALPGLGAGSSFEDAVVLPTDRRGLYVVGPATTLRGDPFGVVRRSVTWTTATELFVLPRTVRLEPLGTGLLKDLEGHTTAHMSMSDLAFHTLREYSPGDDRRHIHWISSAKRSAAVGADEFMVRQFVDTRRSHIGIAVDCRPEAWVDDEEFETAVAAGASIARRALLDGQETSHACGPLVVTRPSRHTALDVYARAQQGDHPLESVAARLARRAPSISAQILLVGGLTPLSAIMRAAGRFGPGVNVVAVRVEHGAPIALQRTAGRIVVTIGDLEDLPRALADRVGS